MIKKIIMVVITIIAVILSAPILIAGVFVLIEAKRKHKVKSRLQRALDHTVRLNQLVITEIEFFNDRVIAIDTENKKLVFAHFRKGVIERLCIDLRLVSACIVSKTFDRCSRYITNVLLQIQLRNQYEPLRLNFYDNTVDDFDTKTILLEKARFWKDQVNHNRSTENLGQKYEHVLN